MAGLGIFDYLSNLNQQAMGGPMSAVPPGAPTALRSVSDFLTNNPALVSNLAYSIGNAPSLRQGVINVGRGMPDAMSADKQTQEASQSKAALGQYLGSPDTAKALTPGQLQFLKALPPDMASKYVAQMMFPPNAGPTNDITDYNFYSQQEKAAGRTPASFADWQTKIKGASQAQENWYGNTQLLQDEGGNITGVLMFSNRGSVREFDKKGNFVREWKAGDPNAPAPDPATLAANPTQAAGSPSSASPAAVAPSGGGTVKPTGSVKIVNQGTQSTIVSPSGVTQNVLPNYVAGQAAQTAIGTASGTAAAGLPVTLNNAQRLLDSIDSLTNDNALDSVVGRYPLGVTKRSIPSLTGDQSRARAEIDQVLGGTFLQAYNDLRGAGAITEAEGQAAKSAYNKLQNTDMDAKDYRAALQEFRTQVLNLMDIAKQRAAMGTSGLPSTSPAVGPNTQPKAAPAADGSDAPDGSTATGPNGQRMIKRNGQWGPL